MDIDIDIDSKFDPTKIFKIVQASMIENDELKKHPVGVYFQNIPCDPITGLSAIPYKDAEDYGFVKIDMLHLNILKYFESKEEIRALLKKSPNWTLLTDKSIVEKLFHIGKHFDIVDKIKPKSITDLSDILALIRPSKQKLLNKYLTNKKDTRKELYIKRERSDLRESHCISYALNIVLQLNLISLGYTL